MKDLEEIKRELGYDNVVIKPHEWEEIAERYRTHALQEAAEKIEMYESHNGVVHIHKSVLKQSILSLIKEKQK